MGAQVLKVVNYLQGQKILLVSNTGDPTEET